MLVDHNYPVRFEPPATIAWHKRVLWNRFTPLQLLTMGLATIAPLVILVVLLLGAGGLVSPETARAVALGAGENPGMITFGAMFLATPVQWLTGRSQVRVRKYLGIVFFLLALSNGAMFVSESGLGEIGSRSLVVAGAIALALATPLFITSSRLSQRMLGMRRWRLLHKLTYVVAIALVGHVLLIPDIGPGAIMIMLGFAARTPRARAWLKGRAQA